MKKRERVIAAIRGEDDCFTVGTLQGIVASVIHPLKGKNRITTHCLHLC